MLSVEPTAIPAVKIITPKKHGDHRGFFSEVYNRAAMAEAGIDLVFVQDNHSL
ncbi:MAG: dTDP-4-dehydrorhamnose 3,5-epimerase family protein, partial [Bosea sp. (in: a-proteobacteria)]